MPNTTSKPRRGDSTQMVYQYLQDRILSLQLRPGEQIEEERLAEACRVSRTPVREALFRLAAEGLVILLPNRVTQVAPLDITTVQDYLESMDLIQRALNRWAALRRSPSDIEAIERQASAFETSVKAGRLKDMILSNREFHRAVAAAAGNALLAESYHRLLDVGIRIARFTLSRSGDGQESHYREFAADIVADHAAMTDAIRRGDADAAERLSVLHTERTRDRFVAYLRTPGDPLSISDPLPPLR